MILAQLFDQVNQNLELFILLNLKYQDVNKERNNLIRISFLTGDNKIMKQLKTNFWLKTTKQSKQFYLKKNLWWCPHVGNNCKSKSKSMSMNFYSYFCCVTTDKSLFSFFCCNKILIFSLCILLFDIWNQRSFNIKVLFKG